MTITWVEKYKQNDLHLILPENVINVSQINHF